MSVSKSETGHAKNVARFEELITFCTAYRNDYHPSNQALTLAALNALLIDAQNAIAGVTATATGFNSATNRRMEAFRPLKSLSTRLVNALSASNASTETVKDAVTINKKLQGIRATPKTTEAGPAAPMPAGKSISGSQQSYTYLVEHFARLISLLHTEAAYQPNEKELKIASLDAWLEALKHYNTEVATAYTSWSNSRIHRNAVLYAASTGLVPVALDVKKYIKSLFGATSPQFKQVNSLNFGNYSS